MSRQRRIAESRAARPSPPPPADDAPEAPPPAEASAAKSSFGALFFFCVGALAMRLVLGVFPGGVGVFDLLVYAGIAISVAVAYRRFVRRSLEARRRERARQQERASRS
ncbi:MAG: hypothetical protein AB7G21_06940 [Dehalococcoidia bacterium]